MNNIKKLVSYRTRKIKNRFKSKKLEIAVDLKNTPKLSLTQLILYKHIKEYENDGKGVYISNKIYADELGLTDYKICRALNTLIKKNLITKTEYDITGSRYKIVKENEFCV